MKIIRFITGAVCISAFLFFPSCKPETAAVPLGDWAREADFPGTPRSGAFSFSIGDVVYVGMGYGNTDVGLRYHSDCYSFNGVTWTSIADFPGVLRERAVAFSINGKGYVGTGYNRDLNDPEMKDFWQYDPATNEWTQLNDFGGNARYNAVGFADGTSGYIGTGYDGTYYNDFWKYNPGEDTWTKFINVGEKRQSAVIIPLDNKFYLLSGLNNGTFINDIWEFDPAAPASSQWTKVSPDPTSAQYANFRAAVSRYDAVGFAIGSQGYIAVGSAGGAITSVYQFDLAAATWTKMTPFERSPRSKGVCFTINGKTFVGTGANGSLYFDDMMQFDPIKVVDPNNN